MANKFVVIVLGSLNAVLVIFVLYFLSHRYLLPSKDAQTIEYKDFISILLTGLAVMIAVMTVFLAGAAIWGYERIRKEAREVAEKEAQKVASAVATRVARDTPRSETTAEDANLIAEAEDEDTP
jgi:predicted membrane protein